MCSSLRVVFILFAARLLSGSSRRGRLSVVGSVCTAGNLQSAHDDAAAVANISERSSVRPPSAMERWLDQAKDLREGTRLYLTNDFSGAEILFKRGFESGAPPVDIADDDAAEDGEGSFTPTDNLEARDMRGAFALQYAIVSLMRGVASLANDQLDECAARLWEADIASLKLDTPWIGKKLVRGVCTLVAGIVQCLQQNIVRGVYNICRSWQWIRYLRSEALEYHGVGSDVVRSSALLALGTFALILSLASTCISSVRPRGRRALRSIARRA